MTLIDGLQKCLRNSWVLNMGKTYPIFSIWGQIRQSKDLSTNEHSPSPIMVGIFQTLWMEAAEEVTVALVKKTCSESLWTTCVFPNCQHQIASTMWDHPLTNIEFFFMGSKHHFITCFACSKGWGFLFGKKNLELPWCCSHIPNIYTMEREKHTHTHIYIYISRYRAYSKHI